MPQVRKIATWAYWSRIFAGIVIAAIAVEFAFSGATLRTPPLELLRAFGITLLFSTFIAAPLGLVMPLATRWIWCRVVFPFNWIAVSVVLAGMGLAGSVAAISTLSAIGIVPRRLLGAWFEGSFKITIVTTLTIGLFITAFEMMRKRLDDATLALRTKERDEADARRLAAEAQLASIESRVQPHFLFNTLNSIAALVHDDPAGAERMTGQLAALLRSSLDGTATPLVPLDEELRVVRAYLDIEHVRFGERLRYTVDVGDGAASALVPRMGLQTLVENSVKYAVSPRREGAAIHLEAIAVNGRLRVAVADDGPGFDPAKRPQGHGLDLLAGRLAMLFGDDATMDVESRPGHTRVTLDLPREAPSADRSGIGHPQSEVNNHSAFRNPQSELDNQSALRNPQSELDNQSAIRNPRSAL